MNNRESSVEDIQRLENLPASKSTFLQAYLNYINSVFGIGFIVLPFVAATVGWLLSALLIMPVLYCAIAQVMRGPKFLIEVADDLSADNILYSDVARVTLGGKWPIFSDILLIIGQVGICVAYLIFLTEFSQIQAQQYGYDMNRLAFLLLTTIIILPLTFVHNIHYLHQASTIALALALGSIFLTLGCFFWGNLIEEVPLQPVPAVKYEGIFNYIGVAIITFEGVMTVLPIRDSMIKKQQFKFLYISATLTTLIIAVVFFEICIAMVGANIESIVIYNISNREVQLLTATLYALTLLLTYPIQLFVALQIIDNILEVSSYSQINDSDFLEQKTIKKNDIFTKDPKSIIQRLIVTLFVYLITYFVPNIVGLLNLLGNVFGTISQYVLPVIFHWAHFKGKMDLPYIQYSLILLFSLIAFVFGPYEFMKN